jgi:hypothetical protein
VGEAPSGDLLSDPLIADFLQVSNNSSQEGMLEARIEGVAKMHEVHLGRRCIPVTGKAECFPTCRKILKRQSLPAML